MQELIAIEKTMKEKASEYLTSGKVDRVIGWKNGELSYDISPSVFTSAEQIEKEFVYNDFCGANLSKFLVSESRKSGKLLVFLKPCDSFSMNQLMTENRVIRDNIYIIGVPCNGKASYLKLKAKGADGIISVERNGLEYDVKTVYGEMKLPVYEIMDDRCLSCKSREVMVFDEMIGENGEPTGVERFDMVEKLENMTPDERFAFWRSELSKCIRCNACRNACPACTCEKCVFDNPNSGVENKAAQTSFEENMFHIIRAFHVAGRCTDCGECSRVCPQNIPLHLLNRKFIKDINSLYGEYQAGEKAGTRSPLISYTTDDPDPTDALKRGGKE